MFNFLRKSCFLEKEFAICNINRLNVFKLALLC